MGAVGEGPRESGDLGEEGTEEGTEGVHETMEMAGGSQGWWGQEAVGGDSTGGRWQQCGRTE